MAQRSGPVNQGVCRSGPPPTACQNMLMTQSSAVPDPIKPRLSLKSKTFQVCLLLWNTHNEKPVRHSGNTDDEKPVRQSGNTDDEKPVRQSGNTDDEEPVRQSGNTHNEKPVRQSGNTRGEKPVRQSGNTQ